MPENLTSITALAGAIGALVAAMVLSLANLVVTIINKRTEERKHFRELIIKAAIENYKEETAVARLIIEKQPQRDIIFFPFDDFIIYMSLLAEHIIDKKLDPEELKQALAEMEKSKKVVREFRAAELAQQQREDAT